MTDDRSVTTGDAGRARIAMPDPADGAAGLGTAADEAPTVPEEGGGFAAERPADDQAQHRRRRVRLVVEWGVVLVVAVVVAICVRTFVFETFFIPSGSMEPTLAVGDRIVVDKLSFDLHPVYVGDIVVFRRPPTWPPEYADLVKRVIGLPGETLWAHDGNVFVDPASCTGTSQCTGPTITDPVTGQTFRQLAETFLPRQDRNVTEAGPPYSPTNLATPYTVPSGDYFVMGDNRQISADSRYYGPVPGSDLVGEVVFRFWPFSRFGVP